MKKSLVLFAAVAALASCSDNLELSSDLTSPKAIQFSTYTNIVSTRGVDTKVANLDSIRVTAIAVKGAVGSQAEENNFFTNLLLTSGDNGTTWSYAGTPYFWPAYNLNFYAHNFPNTNSKVGEGVLNFNSGDDAINKNKHCITFTTGTNIDSLKDIVVARIATVTKDSSDYVKSNKVTLPFTHALTKINVQAKNVKDSLYKFEVKGIKFVNVINKGTYNFGTYDAAKDTIPTGTWTPVARTVNANLVDYRKIDTVKVLKSDEYLDMDFNLVSGASWMFIPQNLPNWTTAGTNKDTTNTKNNSYIALLSKITTRDGGAMVYPATIDTTSGKYTSDGFAWVAIPLGDTLKLQQGKSYVFSLNFFAGKGGAGLVDPEQPADLDGDKKPENDKGKPIIPGTNPDDEGEHPDTIFFGVSVSNWTDASTTDYSGKLNGLDL